MELGIIGLGKMGFNMAERLRLAGHKVVGFDFNHEAVERLTAPDRREAVNAYQQQAAMKRCLHHALPEGREERLRDDVGYAQPPGHGA